MNCSACGYEISEDLIFCPCCGEKIQEINENMGLSSIAMEDGNYKSYVGNPDIHGDSAEKNNIKLISWLIVGILAIVIIAVSFSKMLG
jgi:uncharacterized membrane protein YvbJ